MAADVARRGLLVVVLEKGGYFPESAFGGAELQGMQRLYLDQGMTATSEALKVHAAAGARRIMTMHKLLEVVLLSIAKRRRP